MYLNDYKTTDLVIRFSLGYGILDINGPGAPSNLCGKSSDAFVKEEETVFQLKMGDSSTGVVSDVEAKSWYAYADVISDKAGFICEKEGNEQTVFMFKVLT